MARVQVINSLKPEEGYGQQWRLFAPNQRRATGPPP
jgi:hypothetical protein